MSDVLWFEHCNVYLHRLDALDARFQLYDTLPTATKEEKEVKRRVFDTIMTILQQTRDIEKDLDDLWNLN